MNKLLLAVLFFLMSAGVWAVEASAQNSDAAATDHTAPSYDMKGQSLFDLQAVQKKFVDLANALPADKAIGGDILYSKRLCRLCNGTKFRERNPRKDICDGLIHFTLLSKFLTNGKLTFYL